MNTNVFLSLSLSLSASFSTASSLSLLQQKKNVTTTFCMDREKSFPSPVCRGPPGNECVKEEHTYYVYMVCRGTHMKNTFGLRLHKHDFGN